MSPSNVRYETVDGAPGRYFRCERYGLMNVDACARNYAAAPKLSVEGRLVGCVGCPTGLLHSDGSSDDIGQARALICTRCRRDPADASQYRSTRQGRIRLVRDGALCVSCFNRERELILGKNARGTKPRELALFELTATYVVPNEEGAHEAGALTIPLAKDAIEGALNVFRRTEGKALITGIRAPGSRAGVRRTQKEGAQFSPYVAGSSWNFTDHACNLCDGRIFERANEEGPRYHCAKCGISTYEGVDVICGCGAGADANGRLFECVRNPDRSAPWSAEIAIRERSPGKPEAKGDLSGSQTPKMGISVS